MKQAMTIFAQSPHIDCFMQVGTDEDYDDYEYGFDDGYILLFAGVTLRKALFLFIFCQLKQIVYICRVNDFERKRDNDNGKENVNWNEKRNEKCHLLVSAIGFYDNGGC